MAQIVEALPPESLTRGEEPAAPARPELARNLGALPGDYVTVISPQNAMTAVGLVPKRRFRVAGLFEVGMYSTTPGSPTRGWPRPRGLPDWATASLGSVLSMAKRSGPSDWLASWSCNGGASPEPAAPERLSYESSGRHER